MNIFVEALRRLYSSDKVSIEKVQYFLEEGKINSEELEYIVSPIEA